jgi:hypothetical protein
MGWRKEPVRHGLAAKGIKTGRKSKKKFHPPVRMKGQAVTLETPIRTMDGEDTTILKLFNEERLNMHVAPNWRNSGRTAYFADEVIRSYIRPMKTLGSWKISEKTYLTLDAMFGGDVGLPWMGGEPPTKRRLREFLEKEEKLGKLDKLDKELLAQVRRGRKAEGVELK